VSDCEHRAYREIHAHVGDATAGRRARICVACEQGVMQPFKEWKPIEPTFPEGARFQFEAIGESDEPTGPAPMLVRYVMWEEAYGRKVRMANPVRCF